jgi:hypothetical protein
VIELTFLPWRDAVDQHEVHFREFGGDLLHGLGLGEADRGDQVELLAGEAAQHLLGLGVAAGLGFEDVDAGFFLEARMRLRKPTG